MKNIQDALTKAGRVPIGERAVQAAEATMLEATRRGLVDVAYYLIDSPLGTLFAASTAKGLVRLAYVQDLDPILAELADRVSPRVVESKKELELVRRRLDEYFEGKRQSFDLPLDFRLSNGFYGRVLQATARIPYGQTVSYRDMAEKAGNLRATRAAGNALGSNPIAIVVPCHRVLRTGGDLGGYTGGLDKKIILLRLEKVIN